MTCWILSIILLLTFLILKRQKEYLQTAERLNEYPAGHPLIDDELLGRIGLRMAYFDNYNIFYYYDEKGDVVYIIRILYNKTNWRSILKR